MITITLAKTITEPRYPRNLDILSIPGVLSAKERPRGCVQHMLGIGQEFFECPKALDASYDYPRKSPTQMETEISGHETLELNDELTIII